MIRRLGVMIWCASLAGGLWGLHEAGGGELAVPPGPWRWGHWLDEIEAADAVVAIFRLVGLVCGWYLVAVTVVGLSLGARGLARWPQVATLVPTGLRPLATALLGMTVAGAALVADHPAASASGGPLSGTPTPRGGQVVDNPTPTSLPEDSGKHDTITMSRFDFELGPLSAHSSPQRAAEPWTVQTGDHFWAIAAETLEDRSGQEPSLSEIEDYWLDLIEANRHRLVAPCNPDLLYPGQSLELPPSR